MRRRAPVEVLSPAPQDLIPSRDWQYQHATAVIPDAVSKYEPFSPEDAKFLEIDKRYHYRLTLGYSATKETDHRVPDLVLVRADELALLRTALQTLTQRAEEACLVLGGAKSGAQRVAGVWLREAMLRLFQPPG